MHFFAWTFVVALLPTLVFTAGWEETMQNVDVIEQSLTDDAIFDEVLNDDDQVWNANELFPANDSGALVKEDQQGPQLSIKVDGVPVVLKDVGTGEWFMPFVRDVASRGLISGYRGPDGRPTGLFGPADNVTIEQLAKLAVVAAAVDTFSCGTSLKNTSAKGTWSEMYIRCAEAKGWAVYGDGTVDVSKSATRAEVVVTVLQAFGARIAPRSGTLFSDVTTQTVYGAAVETAAIANIVSGYSDATGKPTGLFGPENFVNRAEAAKIFSLAFQVYDS